jgi:hypothetical protein
VRHKVLDLIGDLALAGRRIEGHVVAERAGHAMHTALVSRLIKDRSAWELAHVPVESDSAEVGTVESGFMANPAPPSAQHALAGILAQISGKQNPHGRFRGARFLHSSASFPVSRIARKDADQVRVLVGNQHPALRGIEHKVARRLASAVGAADGGEAAGLRNRLEG